MSVTRKGKKISRNQSDPQKSKHVLLWNMLLAFFFLFLSLPSSLRHECGWRRFIGCFPEPRNVQRRCPAFTTAVSADVCSRSAARSSERHCLEAMPSTPHRSPMAVETRDDPFLISFTSLSFFPPDPSIASVSGAIVSEGSFREHSCPYARLADFIFLFAVLSFNLALMQLPAGRRGLA